MYSYELFSTYDMKHSGIVNLSVWKFSMTQPYKSYLRQENQFVSITKSNICKINTYRMVGCVTPVVQFDDEIVV